MIRIRLLGITAAVLAVGGLLLGSLPVLAGSGTPPLVIQPLKRDVSPALRTLHATSVAASGMGNHSHKPIRPNQTGPSSPTAAKSIQTTTGTTAMPSTSTNFEGVGNLDNVLPPDTNGDIGPNNYVQWVNLHFEIFDRTGKSLMGPSAGNTLWSGFGGVCDTTNQGDPVVRYDRMANRWVFTQFAFSVNRFGNPVAPFVQCFAVSTTGDPTGTYYRYAWQISSTYFPDYPKLAVWPDAYYMTVNYFSGNTFVGGGALAFDRSKMLAGQTATAVGFGPLGAAYGGLLPSDLDGSILPPSGSANYFGAIDTNVGPSASTFQIWKFHVDFTTPSNSTFGTATHTPDYNLAVDTYYWNMCGGARSCIAQPGTAQGLDPISDRLMNRLQYRRFADGHESLVANHTVGVGANNNQAAIRWYEIRNLSTAPTIYEQGTYAPTSENRWMGSIAMDQSGDIALGYSVSSGSTYPSIRYAGRLASDNLGTLPQGEATIITGSGSQTSHYNRWGDYSMMAVDPTDDCTFWYTQEYYTATSDRGWQTRIASFTMPNCGLPWTAEYGVSTTPTSWTTGQTQTYAVTLFNTGTQNWPAGGTSPVRLGVHFAPSGGGYGVSGTDNTWNTNQRFSLPADVPSGASITISVAVTAPTGSSGPLVLEYQMVKEYQFWFGQFADVNVNLTASWSAGYGVGATPTSWSTGQTQTYAVTLTNNGTQTWPSTGANQVRLGVHFSNKAGGYGSNTWYTDQRFTLPADLAPGSSVTLSISVTAPGGPTGAVVLGYQAVKEYQFWFGQFADVSVNLGASWSAGYSVGTAPTSWSTGQTQSYTITVTNSGTQTWPSTGTNQVRLGVHFANVGGGYGSNTWYTDQRFPLPADLAPGASVGLNISVTPPNGPTGSLILEYQMVKEYQFWFGQVADVSVNLEASWSAGYSVGTTPTSWATGQTQTYAVTVTNNGSQTWPSTGTNLVRLGVHFANVGGGYGSNTWYTDQRFTLPADLAPGTSVTLNIAVTAPSGPTGALVLEYQMVKEYQFWFGQVADVAVQLG